MLGKIAVNYNIGRIFLNIFLWVIHVSGRCLLPHDFDKAFFCHLQRTESRLLTNSVSFALKIRFSLKGLKFVIYVTVIF